jgi:L-rhamnose mutarotase
MPEFVGLRTRLKPGMEDAYEAAHAAVWPELIAAQREFGIRRWLIFRDGLDLFHCIECDDYARAIAQLVSHPVNRLWQEEMSRYTQAPHNHHGSESDRLRLICDTG